MATEHDEVGDIPENAVCIGEEDDADHVEEASTILFPDVPTVKTLRPPEMLASLPAAVKKRVKALKKLQLEVTNMEAKFFKEVHDLECKYHRMYVPMYEKRNTIVNGEYEPTEEESQWQSDDEDLPKAVKDKVKITDGDKDGKEVANDKGIPEFWLTIFRNCSLLSEMVHAHDVPILKYLTDIKTICQEEPMTFTLEFYFSQNEHFSNKVLTKKYLMKCEPDEEDPFAFEGPEIYRCFGCTINWYKGKNVTLKTVKKKQKHKSRGDVRIVTRVEPNDSFFNFFTPPSIPDGVKDEDVDEDIKNLLTSDFEIGHYIRERVVPRAVLFFTGEAIEEEEDFEEEEEDEDDEEEEGDSDNKHASENCKQQ